MLTFNVIHMEKKKKVVYLRERTPIKDKVGDCLLDFSKLIFAGVVLVEFSQTQVFYDNALAYGLISSLVLFALGIMFLAIKEKRK